MGNPIVEMRRSYDRLISTMGFPILVRLHLYIESGPCFFVFRLLSFCTFLTENKGPVSMPNEALALCRQIIHRHETVRWEYAVIYCFQVICVRLKLFAFSQLNRQMYLMAKPV